MEENYIGSIGDKYSIIHNQCKGGYGRVYLVIDNKTQKKYAAKLLVKDKHFLREVVINTLLEKLKIPNIVKFIKSGKDEIIFKDEETEETDEKVKMKYLILEYYEKKDLLRYIMFSGGLAEIYSKVLFKYVLETIQKFHENNIYHLDLKLNNILLDDKFIPKIADFGLSRTIKESVNNKFQGNCGTKSYKPPQMHLKEPFDGSKADIFSLGVTLFFLVTNEYPFEIATKDDEYYNLIKNENYVDFWNKHKKSKNIEVSKDFQELFVQMVHFEENKRPDIGTILSDKWFDEIRNLEGESKNKLEQDYISAFNEKEKKMNEQLKPTKDAKKKEEKPESLNEKVFTNENNLICINDEKIFDNFIRIKGKFNYINFMNEFVKEMNNLYGDTKIIGKNFKLNIIIKLEDNSEENEKEKNDDKKDKDFIIESSEENEKELNILVELFKVKDDEFILSFKKRKGELSDYYQKLRDIMDYAQDFI